MFVSVMPMLDTPEEWSVQPEMTAKINPQTREKISQSWADKNLNMEGLVSFLRKAFPQATEQHVEATTGISAKTVRNWIERVSKPSGDNLMILQQTFGPIFIMASMHKVPGWVEVAKNYEERKQLEREIAAMQKRCNQLMELEHNGQGTQTA